jgi:hypothetical protein
LFSAEGEDDEDPNAVWPKVIAEVSIADALEAPLGDALAPEPSEENDAANPPTAQRVARRALALTAVTARAMLEQESASSETLGTYQDLLGWVNDIEIGEELESDEWEILQRPPNRLESSMQINSTWRLEGLVVLAWALSRFDIPPHDELVKVNPLWQSLGLFDVKASEALLANAVLRPREEIESLRRRLFAIHWRLRNYYLNSDVINFAEYARTCWFGPLDVSGLPVVKGDLALQGKRIDRAAEDVFSSAHSAAQERHQAANWLCDGPELYSEASVAT